VLAEAFRLANPLHRSPALWRSTSTSVGRALGADLDLMFGVPHLSFPERSRAIKRPTRRPAAGNPSRRRESRGKGPPRGQNPPGTADHPLQRKQVFAAALKRVNREIDRMEKLEARAAHIESARRALAMRRATQFPPRPPAGDTPSDGMHPLRSRRRRTLVPPARIGSVSQATRNAQAARDARNRPVQ
jgi:hypothetical protein